MKIFENLISRFEKINESGYVLGVTKNKFNSCGLTFESLLNKKADSMFFPDFENVEIKCKQRYSRYDISLFSLSFDGPGLFESNYLKEYYGKPNTNFEEKKELFVNFKYKEKILVNNNYYFELDIDENDKKIFINIYDLDFRLLEQRGFLYFNSIEERIKIKLQNLALVYASKKELAGLLFFRYYKIHCLVYKDFETFLELIKQNVVKISLIIRISKSGTYKGKNKNKNMLFQINASDIEKLYDTVYIYEN